jgi:tRNA G18 (ribose-2'-O)-methylase SpoU
MRRLVAETCDELAGIAMPGGAAAAGIDSLNVSAAAAVALYELGRPL